MPLTGKNFQIRSLVQSDFRQMYKAFNFAFSDYVLPIHLSYDQFEIRFLQKLKIDFELSAGAFVSKKLVGFIFTGIGTYEGSKIAYNGGTGVIPAFRGNQLTYKLYNYLFPVFKKNKVEACVLEVLTDNQKALHVYKAIDFQETKYFHSFRKDYVEKEFKDEGALLKIKSLNAPDWNLFKSFSDTNPSFLDSFDVITRNIENEKIIVYEIENAIAGYAIYQPELGRISQLAVDNKYRRRGVGTALVHYIILNSQTIAVTVMNVNTKSLGILQFLKQLGFENQLDQYEMYLPLS